ncbi:probable serine/threonine-protein kinase DDB_G0271682 [Dysidea avara]|uniref:probable serine/threonine-protein kinase DDB_G0271682 n=1 Tax=Dysidea avara TaxID=196820 RepID=UPI00331B452C
MAKREYTIGGLCNAAGDGRLSDVQQHLQNGVDANGKDFLVGYTPLHLAAYYNHYDVCLVLLQHGARVEEKNKDNKTPLDFAKTQGHRKVVQLLKSYAQKKTSVQQQDQSLHQRVQELERQLQSLREEKNLIIVQKQQLLEDNQNLQQRIHGQEAELQNLRQEKQENQRLLQQQRQEIQHLQQQQFSNTLQQQQTWLVDRNEISLKEKELGRGAYGWVKEATFRGCKVAVKCLHNELISDYNLHVFDREMTMAARCRHPNLLQFIGATNEGVPLIVTEMMHTSLRKVLERGQLSSDQIIPIAAGIAFGLNYLHKTTPSPILHRDVSSANILLNPLPDNQWLPKLSDFGSFNFMRESQTVNAGNPVYAAPEALDPSKGPHTPAMDTFSLGVLLYEMCSRRLPTGVFSVSMLQRVTWRVPESNMIPLITACADQMIQRRPSMDGVITQLNSIMGRDSYQKTEELEEGLTVIIIYFMMRWTAAD